MDNKEINNNIFNKKPFALFDLENIPVGLRETHKLLTSKNWKNRLNNEGNLVYSKDDEIFDEFRIKLAENYIQVSVPLPNSEFLYKCKFNNYFDSYDFIVQHLHNYEISKKTQSLYEEVKKKDNSLNKHLESN